MNIKNIIESQEGYIVITNIIPIDLIDSFYSKLSELRPVRASSSKKVYAEKEQIQHLSDIAVWWSQTVEKYHEVIKIEKIIGEIIKKNFETLDFYTSDTVTIQAYTNWINPHVDTPHRFKRWNYDKRLLGLQCIVPMFDLNDTNGSTGLLPFSQKNDFNINLCYKDFYTNQFNRNAIQPAIPKGSVLIYNCRVLHSSMPNKTDKNRPALLLNYLERSIMDEVKQMDNIWTSNT